MFRGRHLVAKLQCQSLFLTIHLKRFKTNISIKANEPAFKSDSPWKGKQEAALIDFLKNKNNISFTDVEQFKDEILPIGDRFNAQNFDATFIEFCRVSNSFEIGKSFFYELIKNSRLSLGVLGKFCRLCYSYQDLCTDEDRTIIKKMYCKLKEKHPLLDSKSCESISFGLAITDLWKESISLLKMASDVDSATTAHFCVAIEAAFKNKDWETGWHLLEEAMKNDERNMNPAFNSWLVNSSGTSQHLETLLLFLKKHNLEPDEELVQFIQMYSEKIGGPHRDVGKLTKISQSGHCGNCNQLLEKVNISQEDFDKLREVFLNETLIQRDIFLRSKPSEFKNYLQFLEDSGEVDVVLDGLNVAYAAGSKRSSPKVCANMLKNVVQHFLKKDRKVMVIGRKHMLKWPSGDMKYIKKNSALFLTENVSADDPMILYAAMHSGLGTKFVSRDMMKGHKFKLKDPKLKQLFSRWQKSHQLYLLHVEDDGIAHFQEPVPYLQEVQRGPEGEWHLPVNTGIYANLSPHLKAKMQTWLCLKLPK